MRKNEKITALYERLSRDDFGKDDDQQRESNSISNQKAMLEEFAARQGFIYRRILNEQYRNQHRYLPDCQKADRQNNLYRPCAFQPDRKGDDGGQNQAWIPKGIPYQVLRSCWNGAKTALCGGR